MDLGSKLHFLALVALNTQSGVYQEFGSEVTGMSLYINPKTRNEIVSGGDIFWVDYALGETRTLKVTKGNEGYKPGALLVPKRVGMSYM